MILNNSNDVETTLEDEGQDFSIDMESMSVLFKGFSDNLYSNKIGSIVREITSNCFDAHKELGVNKDVEIMIRNPDSLTGQSGMISFRDYGIGLSPDRIKNIYSKYFSSTKRSSNDEIGGFGIGAKSPLSYTEFFEVNTIVDGILYQYMVHRGVKVPRIELLNQEETDMERGTDIIIPIKSEADLQSFKKELKSQLKFFDNIRYINCDIDNDYKIIKGKHFILRDNGASTNMGLCIGRVAYPLDYEQMNLQEYNQKTQLSLLFDIGDLQVTMNREAVEYTDAAKEAISKKLKLAAEEIMTLRTEALKDEEDIAVYCKGSTRTNSIILNGEVYNLPAALTSNMPSKPEWNFKPLKDLTLFQASPSYFGKLFSVRGLVINGNLNRKQRYTRKDVESLLEGPIPIYRIKGPATKKKMTYISDTMDRQYYLVSMRSNIYDPDIFVDDNGLNVTSVSNYDSYDKKLFEQELRKYVNHVGKYLVNKTTSYDKIEIDPEWEEEYKSTLVSPQKNTEEITIRQYYSMGSFSKWKVKISDIFKWRKDSIKIYAFQGEEYELGMLFAKGVSKEFSSYFSDNFKVFKISRDNARKLRNLDNFYHFTEIPDNLMDSIFHREMAANRIQREYLKISEITESAMFPVLLYGKAKNVQPGIALGWKLAKFAWVREWHNNYVYMKNSSGDHDIWDIKNEVFIYEFVEELVKYINENPLIEELTSIGESILEDSSAFKLIKETLKLNIKPFIYKK